MSRHGSHRLAAWPHVITIVCVLIAAGCQDGSGPSLVAGPDPKTGAEGARPQPPPADPAIAFQASPDLKVMNADGSNVATIYHSGLSNTLMFPSWSPGGGSVAFSLFRGPGYNLDLMLIDVAVVSGVPVGTNLRVLLDRTNWLVYPAWSPAGDRIAFGDNSARTLEVIPAAGGTPVVVYTSTLPPGWAVSYFPAWSRDANQIAFVDRDAASDVSVIRSVDVTTGELTTLLGPELAGQITEGERIEALDWGRVSDVLTFNTGFNPRKIYTLAIPGGIPTFVVEGRAPTWSPDDTEIFFVGNTGSGKISKVNLATGLVTRFGASGAWPDRRRF